MRLLMPFLMYLTLWISLPAFAVPIEQCGQYQAEGYLSTQDRSSGKMNLVLLLDREAENEIEVDLGTYNAKQYQHYIGTKVNLVFEIDKQCTYHCNGKLVKIVKLLEPYAHIKSFSFPKPKPIKIKPCRDM